MSGRRRQSRAAREARPRRIAFLTILALVALFAVSSILVQARTDDFALAWWTVDGGGGASSGAGFGLQGTVGQSDAGPTLQGGGYALKGGYWAAGGASANLLYLPLVQR